MELMLDFFLAGYPSEKVNYINKKSQILASSQNGLYGSSIRYDPHRKAGIKWKYIYFIKKHLIDLIVNDSSIFIRFNC